jgi:hypothetical protein
MRMADGQYRTRLLLALRRCALFAAVLHEPGTAPERGLDLLDQSLARERIVGDDVQTSQCIPG